MLTSGEYKQCLSDLLNSMMNRDKIPIYSHTERDKNLDDTDLLISKRYNCILVQKSRSYIIAISREHIL